MPLQPTIPRRKSIPRESVAYDYSGGSPLGAPSGIPLTESSTLRDSLLVLVDLVDTSGVAVDGTATDVDNVALTGSEIVLRAAGIGAGGHVNNGVWQVPTDPTDPWTRYRKALHVDGLLVLVRRGAADVSTATAPNVPYGGMAETMWKLITNAPFTLGTDAIEFRQMPILDAMTIEKTAALPGYLVPPIAGAVPLAFTQFQPNHVPLYYSVTLGAGAITTKYSGLHDVYLSILLGHTSTGGTIAAGLWKNGAFEREIIRQVITTADERHNGKALTRMSGDANDTIDLRLYDPAGAGFLINITDYYASISIGPRR